MRVFDFTLLSGYEFSGVDVAQGFRARLFAKNNVNAKFIFTELPTIIDDGQNGYKIPITDEMDQKEKIKLLSERIVRMFTEDDMDAFSGHSYEKAKEYLTKEVVHRWIELLK